MLIVEGFVGLNLLEVVVSAGFEPPLELTYVVLEPVGLGPLFQDCVRRATGHCRDGRAVCWIGSHSEKEERNRRE